MARPVSRRRQDAGERKKDVPDTTPDRRHIRSGGLRSGPPVRQMHGTHGTQDIIFADATHQQETLAIIEAMESFAHLLLHKHFTVITNHKGLTKLMTQKNLNGRQQRWLTHISKFDYQIEYQQGAKIS